MTEGTAQISCGFWDNGECTGTALCPPRCPRFIDRKGEPIIVRPFEDGDEAGLIGLYERATYEDRSNGWPPKGRPAIDAWFARVREAGWGLVATHRDRLVGHVGAVGAETDEPELIVFVDRTYQGRGIGKELIRQLIAYAADRGHSALQLFVDPTNEPAIAIYENLDFEITEERLAAVQMRLALDEPVADRVQQPPVEW